MLRRERGKAPLSIGDGLAGRRTGVTVEDTGERDADGFVPMDNYYPESEDDEEEEEKTALKGTHKMSDFKVQRDDSDDEQPRHVNLPPQTPARVPVTKTQAVGLNDVTQRTTNQLPRQANKPATRQPATIGTPHSARKLRVVSAVPVSRTSSQTTSKTASFRSASQTSSTAPKVTKIKSIQPVSSQPQKPAPRQPSPNDTVDSIDSPAPYSNPYVAPPTKYVPKSFTASKPFSTDSVFKTPARAHSLYGDSPADSTPGIPTPGFKPTEFNPAEFKAASFQFGATKDVFDIPEDEPVGMDMDMDMDMDMGMGEVDMSMDMGHDQSMGFENEVKSVRPTDVFVSPNVGSSRDSRGSLFDSPDVPKPLPKKGKGKEAKKPVKERQPSFAEKYKPRDFSKASDDLFKPFKVPSKTTKIVDRKKTEKAAPKAAPKKAEKANSKSKSISDDYDSGAMDFTSLAKNSSSVKDDISNDSIDFEVGGGGDDDYDMGGFPAEDDSLGSLDDSISERVSKRFDRSINYKEISTLDDSRVDYEDDSDDDFHDQSFRLEDDVDDDDDEYNSAVDESMIVGKGALPSPPRSKRRRNQPRRNVGRPLRWWMGEEYQYQMEKTEGGQFVPTVKGVTRMPDTVEETEEKRGRKKRKAFDIGDAVVEAEVDAQENKLEEENKAALTKWEKKKHAEVEVVNYVAEEGDPDTISETVAYTHDGCEYTDPSPEGLSVAQLFGDKKDFTQSGMVRLIGGGGKPERNSRHHLHHFYVLSGTVDATIGETVLRIKAGCPFIVPRGTQFALKNASGTIEALLFYVRSHDTLLRYEERAAQAELEEMEALEQGEAGEANGSVEA